MKITFALYGWHECTREWICLGHFFTKDQLELFRKNYHDGGVATEYLAW